MTARLPRLKNTKNPTLRTQLGQRFRKGSNRARTMPARSRAELFAKMPLHGPEHRNQSNPPLTKCPTPLQAYDQSMAIRSKFTTRARTVRQHLCDANLAQWEFSPV